MKKFDNGKIRWSLMPWAELLEVCKVFMFGAEKYTDHGYRTVPNARERYWEAAMRHLLASREPGARDPESKLYHAAHLVCSALIFMWHDNNSKVKDDWEDLSEGERP